MASRREEAVLLNILSFGWVTGHDWRLVCEVLYEIYDKVYIVKTI